MKHLTVKEEEEVMRILWEGDAMFVRDILSFYPDPKPHYNTVSTVVRSLEEKGFVGYTAYGNTYRYHAIVTEREYRQKTLKGIISQYYNDSYLNVVSSFIEEEQMSVDELKELVASIEQARAKKP